MKKDNAAMYNSYHLLQKVLQDTFQMETVLFTPPYGDFSQIDQGLRAIVWTDYNKNDTKLKLSENSSRYKLVIVKSNLGFYNILAFFGTGEKPDFISVGPFRDEVVSAYYFSQILRESNLKATDIQGIKYIYERMPIAQVDTVSGIMQHIISAFVPEFEQVIPEFLEYSEQNRAVSFNKEFMQDYSMEHTRLYKELLFDFLGNLKRGDLAKSQASLKLFLKESKLLKTQNIREYKQALQSINDYCHITLLDTAIHPSHIMTQAFSIRARIDNMTSRTKLEHMSNDICHKYCLLVKNYANPEYSKITRDVIDYIQLHMEEELSLAYFSTYFNKNASALSSTFSRDTGMSLTKFIHQTRIQEAVKYLNTTDMSISEIAVAVGYQDFSYFSKLFTRVIGCSPREYRGRRIS